MSDFPRHARQIMLREIGGAGQARLAAAHVGVIGAGALGGPCALYLAAAGVGTLSIIDDDRVEPTNLQRQIQFSEADIGTSKAESLAATLRDLDTSLDVRSHDLRLTAGNTEKVLGGSTLLVDATDSFTSRFAVDAAAHALGVACVSGAVARFDAQVSVFRADAEAPCYRCFVPDLPPNAAECDTVGIVGAVAGMAASLMALEAVKRIAGVGESLSGRLWVHEGMSAQTRVVGISRDPACPHHDSRPGTSES